MFSHQFTITGMISKVRRHIFPSRSIVFAFASMLIATRAGESAHWPMHGGNAKHDGFAADISGPTSVTIKWRFLPEAGATYTAGGGNSGPVVGPDGTIFMPSSEHFYAINPDGTRKWRIDKELGDAPFSGLSVALSKSGDTLFIIKGWVTIAFLEAVKSSDGTLLWCTPLFPYPTQNHTASIVVDNSGKIYVTSSARPRCSKRDYIGPPNLPPCVAFPELFSKPPVNAACPTAVTAYSDEGSLVWQYTSSVPGDIDCPPAVDDNGNVYFIQNTVGLVKLDSDGQFEWVVEGVEEHSGPYKHKATPSIGVDGTIYVDSKKLLAVNPDGTIKWERQDLAKDSGALYSGIALSDDGSTLFRTYKGVAYAINSLDGSTLYSDTIADTTEWFGGSPLLAENGILYVMGYNFGTDKDKVYCIQTADASLLWQYELNSPVLGVGGPQSPAIGPDGTLYVKSCGTPPANGGDTTTLLAFGYVARSAPQVEISSPASGHTVTLGESIELVANASDADGNISKIIFFADFATIGSGNATATGYELVWTPSASDTGNVSLTALAIDNDGLKSRSAKVGITVESSTRNLIGINKRMNNREVRIRVGNRMVNIMESKNSEVQIFDGNGRRLFDEHYRNGVINLSSSKVVFLRIMHDGKVTIRPLPLLK